MTQLTVPDVQQMTDEEFIEALEANLRNFGSITRYAGKRDAEVLQRGGILGAYDTVMGNLRVLTDNCQGKGASVQAAIEAIPLVVSFALRHSTRSGRADVGSSPEFFSLGAAANPVGPALS